MPGHYKDKFSSKQISNVFYNITGPYQKATTGALVQVAADSAVEMIVRRFLKTKAPMYDVVLAHALSLPFRGAPFVFAEGEKAKEDPKPVFHAADELTGQAMQGMYMAPSVFLGQYIVATAGHGLHYPKIESMNIVSVVLAQALSQVLLKYAADWFPKGAGESLKVLRQIFNEQKKTGINA